MLLFPSRVLEIGFGGQQLSTDRYGATKQFDRPLEIHLAKEGGSIASGRLGFTGWALLAEVYQ